MAVVPKLFFMFVSYSFLRVQGRGGDYCHSISIFINFASLKVFRYSSLSFLEVDHSISYRIQGHTGPAHANWSESLNERGK